MSTRKLSGHRRRPSIGKDLPISTLFLNQNITIKPNYDHISRDGISPDILDDKKLNFPIKENLKNDTSSDDDENDDETEKLRGNFNIVEFKEQLAIAEALAQASMLTSSAVKRRLAARKVEMELENSQPFIDGDGNDYIPPRELLIYLVRMGSFNSAPKVNNTDSQDDDVRVPNFTTQYELIQYCQKMRGGNLPQLIQRQFFNESSNSFSDITDNISTLKLDNNPRQIRILQWNILSQTLGQYNDGFVCCPEEALQWDCRKYQIVQEILTHSPDIICLQEVDHFKFLQTHLSTQGYEGVFFPKPDSPCLYVKDNNGPDGCAIFYNKLKFEKKKIMTRILEVWRVQSNQVAIVINFSILETGDEFTISTTHLKARNGALLSKLRNEQGNDLLQFIYSVAENRPVILCGDFNAEPTEPVYSTILQYKNLGLSSAYADINISNKLKEAKLFQIDEKNSENNCKQNPVVHVHDEIHNTEFKKNKSDISAFNEPPYTTWKIREDGEVCHTLDYVFYTQNKLKILNCLNFPTENDLGKNRAPSFVYPSDHFSLVCDFELIPADK